MALSGVAGARVDASLQRNGSLGCCATAGLCPPAVFPLHAALTLCVLRSARRCRLHELVLLDLPPMLTWLVASVKKLVHPDTRDKARRHPLCSRVCCMCLLGLSVST